MTSCWSCRSPRRDDDRFCPSCGREQPATETPRRNVLLERLAAATTGMFEFRGEIGRGGMAAVFLAQDLRSGRKVAVKLMFPELVHSAGMVERFRREARTAARLQHSNIVTIYSIAPPVEPDLHFFVMSLVEGVSLAGLLAAPAAVRAGPLAIPLVQSLVVQIGSALDYAHRHGVIHRDVTPANIMLDTRGHAIVTDFGIAKAAESSQLTQTGATIGTPAYMSPEQCKGEPVAGASDQYSLGAVAFELLTGQAPFVAPNKPALMYKHVQEPPPEVADLRPDTPAPLAAAVMRMLAKRPEDRFPTVREALDALTSDFDEHDDAPRRALGALAARIGPIDASRFAGPPVSPAGSPVPPFSPAAWLALEHESQSSEIEVGAAFGLPPQMGLGAGTSPERAPGWAARDLALAPATSDGRAMAVGRAAGAMSRSGPHTGPRENVAAPRPRRALTAGFALTTAGLVLLAVLMVRRTAAERRVAVPADDTRNPPATSPVPPSGAPVGPTVSALGASSPTRRLSDSAVVAPRVPAVPPASRSTESLAVPPRRGALVDDRLPAPLDRRPPLPTTLATPVTPDTVVGAPSGGRPGEMRPGAEPAVSAADAERAIAGFARAVARGPREVEAYLAPGEPRDRFLRWLRSRSVVGPRASIVDVRGDPASPDFALRVEWTNGVSFPGRAVVDFRAIVVGRGDSARVTSVVLTSSDFPGRR